jgi:glycosyltransferase involved in cell wall biosynthesis
MARIVIDARELTTGIGRYVERLLHYLQKLESPHEFIVLLKPEDYKVWQPSNPNFKKWPTKYKEFSFGEQLGFAMQLRRLQPDLVHFSAPQQPVLYFGKSVTTVHDLTTARFDNPAKNWLVFKIKQLVYRAVIFWVAHKSKRLITPSKYVRKDLADFARINPHKITVTYEAADRISEPATALPNFRANKFLLYVGRPTPHKNLKRLMEAFSITKHSHPDLKLILAGKRDLNYEKLEDWADHEKIEDVIFTGFVGAGQLRWLYEHATAYIFPSLSEGFGLPGLEAMAHGLPVLSSKATCLPEIYKDAALYFDPENVKDISDKIIRLLDNDSLAKELSQRGRELAGSYSWQKTADETLKVYSAILN